VSNVSRDPESSLSGDAIAIARAWREGLDLTALIGAQVADLAGPSGVDLVALGKAAPEMAAAATAALGARVRRRFIASDTFMTGDPRDVVVTGEHPVPGPGSAEAGRRLLEFLDTSSDVELTLFLISGGASSICVAPVAPLALADLGVVWDRALALGWDITRLNHVRAATSALGGGAVLRRVRTGQSRSLVMVDNVVAGARWVASGLTFDYRPSRLARRRLRRNLGLLDPDVARRIGDAMRGRAALMRRTIASRHENRVLVEPQAALIGVADEARRRGLSIEVMDDVSGDIMDVVEQWADRLNTAPDESACFAGVGEVTVRVQGSGRGGRCQEFALRLAPVLSDLGRPGVCVALATDGRDFLEDVAGAWTDESTVRRLAGRGDDVGRVLARHDANGALGALGQVIEGGRTGWNLCDVYVVVLGPRPTPAKGAND
jgi:glycerate 2-kinase